MTREWKPGDVAVIPFSAGDERAMWLGDRWAVTGNRAESVAYAIKRRLVVIDPEDREQVERLIRAQVGSRAGCPDALVVADAQVDGMQAALRSLVEPPKPKEPTHPEARVTDRRDNIWRLLADGDWVCTSGPDIGEYLVWERLASERGPVSIEVADR